MFSFLKLNLQLFADGVSATSEGQTNGETSGNATATAQSIPGLPSTAGRKNKSNPLANVRYGKQEPEASKAPSAENSAAQPQPTDATGAQDSSELSFDELIRSDKYKAEYTKAVEKAVNQRLKKYKGMETQLEKLQPVLQLAGNQYGLDPTDSEFATKLSAAMNGDDHFFEKYALDHGCSVEEARRVVTLKQQIDDLDRQKQERERQAQFDREWGRVLSQAEATKQQFPAFDLDAEMQNERFAKLVAGGIDTTAAFIATHHKDIIPATVQMATKEAVQQTVNAVKANQSRPVENGLAPSATAIVKDDPSQFKLADFRQIRDNFRKTGVRPKF